MLAFFLDRVLMTESRNALKSDFTASSVIFAAAPDEVAAACDSVAEREVMDFSLRVGLATEKRRITLK